MFDLKIINEDIFQLTLDTDNVDERCEGLIKMVLKIEEYGKDYYIVFVDDRNVVVDWEHVESYCIRNNINFIEIRHKIEKCLSEMELYIELVNMNEAKKYYNDDKFFEDLNEYKIYEKTSRRVVLKNRYRIYNKDVAMKFIEDHKNSKK